MFFSALLKKKGISLQQPRHCSTVLTLLSVSLFLLIDLIPIMIFLPLLVFASRLQNGTEYPYSCDISLCELCRTFWGCIVTWNEIRWTLFELCPGRPKATLGLGIINSSTGLNQWFSTKDPTCWEVCFRPWALKCVLFSWWNFLHLKGLSFF